MIEEARVRPLAEQLFRKANGFEGATGKHARMYETAEEVLLGIAGRDVEGFFCSFPPDHFKGGCVEIEGTRIHAAAFEQIPPGSVRRIWLYAITAGRAFDVPEDAAPLMERLYAYLWGTAYVDAGRLLLESDIKARAQAPLSPAFSPGFYGMDNTASGPIIEYSGGGALGIECHPSGVMTPIKTCSGVYLEAETDAFPGDECLVCTGNPGGCSQCFIRNKRQVAI
ncbi:MAG: hypothetical protein LBR44_08030 [Clostridiales Family XIII bacterium]|nr:hypothetical protein [Clostridiales Family XIII bacterium]